MLKSVPFTSISGLISHEELHQCGVGGEQSRLLHLVPTAKADSSEFSVAQEPELHAKQIPRRLEDWV